jgi:hypothetical protein
MKAPVQIFKTAMGSSDVAYSRERASHRIGRPDTPISQSYALSRREVSELIANLDEELLNEVIKVHQLGEPQTPAEPSFFDPSEIAPEILEVIKHHYGLIEMEALQKELEDGLMGKKQFEELTNEETTPENVQETQKVAENEGLNHGTIEVETEQSGEITPESTEDDSIDIMELGVRELKPIAKDLGIEGYTKMNKEQLQEAILEATKEDNE